MANDIKDHDGEQQQPNDEPGKVPRHELPNQKHKPHPHQDNPLEPKQGI